MLSSVAGVPAEPAPEARRRNRGMRAWEDMLQIGSVLIYLGGYQWQH